MKFPHRLFSSSGHTQFLNHQCQIRACVAEDTYHLDDENIGSIIKENIFRSK